MINYQLTPSDINEHLPTLRMLASLCSTVTEFGVRSGVSTQAFLATDAVLTSYDIDPQPFPFFPPNKFIQASTLDIEIEQTDLLFIDTDHSYKQLSQELALHHAKVNCFIVLHDTTTYGKELIPAIHEFLSKNTEWYLLAQYLNNNGLTVLTKLPTRAKTLPLLI